MTLIIPQSGNKKFRKTSNRRLNMRKAADGMEALNVLNEYEAKREHAGDARVKAEYDYAAEFNIRVGSIDIPEELEGKIDDESYWMVLGRTLDDLVEGLYYTYSIIENIVQVGRMGGQLVVNFGWDPRGVEDEEYKEEAQNRTTEIANTIIKIEATIKALINRVESREFWEQWFKEASKK